MTSDSCWRTRSEYSVRVTPEDLQTALARALTLADSGLVAPQAAAAEIDVTAPRCPELGDWSTTLALRTAAAPTLRRELAEQLCSHLRTLPEVAAADVAGPGFVNITLTPAARAQIAFDIVAAGPAETAGHLSEPDVASSASLDSSGPTDVDRPLPPAAAADSAVIAELQLRHASACRERRRARQAGISLGDGDASMLDHPSEARLLGALAAVPDAFERSRRLGDGAPFVSGLNAVGDAIEDWLSQVAVTPTIDEDITGTHAARLVLVSAAIIVLAAGLRQLGATAPERI
jgi:arginyl-tRNA synthetase